MTWPARFLRLVPSRFDPPILRQMAASDAEFAALIDLDNYSNDRVRAELGQPLDGQVSLTPRETLIHAAYADFINAAFAHPGEGARFHDTHYGCWYAGDELLTAYAEVAFHRVSTWLAGGITDEDAEYTAYTSLVGEPPFRAEDDPDYRAALAANPDDYRAGQALARRLRAQDLPSLSYQSVRRKGHLNVALLFPEAVQDVRQEARYLIEWRASEIRAFRRA